MKVADSPIQLPGDSMAGWRVTPWFPHEFHEFHPFLQVWTPPKRLRPWPRRRARLRYSHVHGKKGENVGKDGKMLEHMRKYWKYGKIWGTMWKYRTMVFSSRGISFRQNHMDDEFDLDDFLFFFALKPGMEPCAWALPNPCFLVIYGHRIRQCQMAPHSVTSWSWIGDRQTGLRQNLEHARLMGSRQRLIGLKGLF